MTVQELIDILQKQKPTQIVLVCGRASLSFREFDYGTYFEIIPSDLDTATFKTELHPLEIGVK